MKNSIPDAKRTNEVISIMAETINKIATAKSQDEATKAIARMFALIPDIMNIPAYQHALGVGFAMGARDKANTMSAAELILLRKQAKMSQIELANAIGVVQSRISTWETDREPIPLQHIETIRRVCAEASAGATASADDESA